MSEFGKERPASEWRGVGRRVPLAQALAELKACCAPVAPIRCRLDDAVDRIAAAAICTPAAVPSKKIALREGWAVAAEETIGASNYAPVFASDSPLRVNIGDVLPERADAVLPSPCIDAAKFPLEILSAVAPGEGARAVGEDFGAGETIVAEGERLRPRHIALLYMAGIAEASLRAPRVAILADDEPSSGVGEWLASLARREGADCFLIKTGKNMGAPGSASDADLVLALGGRASGAAFNDWRAVGVSILAEAVAVQPGEGLCCGVLTSRGVGAGAPFIFAPDRMDLALATWLLLARPCLRRLTGAAALARGETLPLARKIVSSPGMSDLVLLRRTHAGGAGIWEPLAVGDLPLNALAKAEAWLLVEPDCEGYPAAQHIFAEYL